MAKKNTEKLRKWYNDQLREKDELIESLRKENAVLLATALKQGNRTREIFEKTDQALKKEKPKKKKPVKKKKK